MPEAGPLRHRWPLDLPRVPGTRILEAPQAGVVVDANAVVRRFLRYAPEFVDDPAGLDLALHTAPAVYRSPPPFLLTIPDAVLVGYRTILLPGGFTNDAELEGAERDGYLDLLALADPFPNEETGLRREPGGDAFHLQAGGRPERRLAGPHIVLCSHEPANYGSFLFRVAAKLCDPRLAALGDLPVVVHARNRNVVRLLELLGIAPERIVQHDAGTVTRIDRALVPSLRNPHAYLDRESALLFQSLGERFFPGEPHRRIYVSRRSHARGGGTTRVLVNEDELIRRLVGIGFEIVEPEELGMEEQIATFASARIVVGPSGSAMFNVMFCRPGTKVVDIESEPHWIYAHAGLFASCQLRYGFVSGLADPADERPVHRRWSVDVEALIERIARFDRA